MSRKVCLWEDGVRKEGEVPSRGCSVGPGRKMNRVGAERMER